MYHNESDPFLNIKLYLFKGKYCQILYSKYMMRKCIDFNVNGDMALLSWAKCIFFNNLRQEQRKSVCGFAKSKAMHPFWSSRYKQKKYFIILHNPKSSKQQPCTWLLCCAFYWTLAPHRDSLYEKQISPYSWSEVIL